MRLSHLLVALIVSGPAASYAARPYSVVRTIPLGAPERWDYVSFDPASGHVLVAHGDHTDIVDPPSGRVLGTLKGLQGAHGQVAVGNAIYADSGLTGTLTGFDAASHQPLGSVAAGKDADGVIYEPVHRVVAVMDGDASTATLIDSPGRTVRAVVPLGGEPEFAVADGTGRVYVNLASTRQVAVLDVARNAVTQRYAVADCESPHGLALDTDSHRLFVSCVNRKMVVVDSQTGDEVQSLPIGAGTDSAAFDSRRKLAYSANGSGTLSVFHEGPEGRLSKVGEFRTQYGARTMAVDPASGQVFLVTGDPIGAPVAGRRPRFQPGSVRLLVLAGP